MNLSMNYEDEERLEPEGASLETARRIMEQLGTLIANVGVDGIKVVENGVLVSLNYVESRSRCGQETHYHQALLTWDGLFNGDLLAWACDAERADVERRREEEAHQRARAEEARRKSIDETVARRRREDLETYERIKAEMEGGSG